MYKGQFSIDSKMKIIGLIPFLLGSEWPAKEGIIRFFSECNTIHTFKVLLRTGFKPAEFYPVLVLTRNDTRGKTIQV